MRRKFCDGACRSQWHRGKKDPTIQQRAQVPPNNGIPDDPTQLAIGEILQLKLEPTLRKAILDLKAKFEERERELKALQSQDNWKEERVLNDEQAREVARFLAQKYYAS